jgi:putative transposase
MTAEWCVNSLQEAISHYGKPEIINSDQGSQFTSDCYIELLKSNEIQISMDGKGRALDNIFIERLWRSVKQEYVYLNPCETGQELWRGLSEYFRFYNTERPHQSLSNLSPETWYCPPEKAA